MSTRTSSFANGGNLDLWNLPGGGMESDETPWQAVIREVVEEVGWMTEDLKAAILREMKFGRLGQPEDVARLVVFLAAMPASGSPDRRFTHGARDWLVSLA